MSRTIKGSKDLGFEYWGKRKFNKNGNLYGPGRKTKKTTLRAERAASKCEISELIAQNYTSQYTD